MKVRILITLLLILLATVTSSAADDPDIQVLVFRDGGVKTVKSWTRDGAVVKIIGLEGKPYSVQTDDVDFEKSRLATLKARQPKATPTPTPKEKSIVELSRELQRKRQGRPTATVELERGDDVPEVAEPPRTAPRVTPVLTSTPNVAPDPSAATGSATPEQPTPQPSPSISTTPTPKPASTQAPPQPSPTPASTTAEEDGGGLGVLPFAIGGLVLVGVGAGLFVLKRRRDSASDDTDGDDQHADGADDEELFAPAFADDADASDAEPASSVSDDMFEVPEELPPTRETRALVESTSAPSAPGSSRAAAPAMFVHGQELQIRIGADVYSCPDLATLASWVAEGRVVENSEVLSPEGTWLMAGSIPDLESAFEERRQNLGY